MQPFPTFPSPCVGYYMFIEASRPRVTGDKARLISPLYNITAKYYCVSFYYHMYGKHIGEYRLGTGSPSLDLSGKTSSLSSTSHDCSQQFGWVGVPLQCSMQQDGLQMVVPYPQLSSARIVRLLQPVLGTVS